MSPEKAGGMPSTRDKFHETMRALYRDQRSDDGPLANENQYHVQAKLPAQLYREFHQVLKKNNWSISTGVQYAIHSLSLQQHRKS